MQNFWCQRTDSHGRKPPVTFLPRSLSVAAQKVRIYSRGYQSGIFSKNKRGCTDKTIYFEAHSQNEGESGGLTSLSVLFRNGALLSAAEAGLGTTRSEPRSPPHSPARPPRSFAPAASSLNF